MREWWIVISICIVGAVLILDGLLFPSLIQSLAAAILSIRLH